jgi:transposase-like protein
MAVKITRTDYTAEDLRREAGRARTPAPPRMLAIALVLEDVSRCDAARQCGMDRQTLRDWVHRFNGEGPEGLYDRRRPGPAPRLTPEQEADLGFFGRDRGNPPPNATTRPQFPFALM